jgi:Fur family transcriptional regulator, zinc uptake regulator
MKVRRSSLRRETTPHDHRACVSESLGAAEALAHERKLRLTPRRREVLEIVARSHRPIGAYDVLAKLTKLARENLAPPTVYRALDFLQAHGLVHRISSQNAYVACFAPRAAHRAHFLLCECCGCATEIADPTLDAALTSCAKRARFTVARETVEISGRCRTCVEADK